MSDEPQPVAPDVAIRRILSRLVALVAALYIVLVLLAGPLSLSDGLPPVLSGEELLVAKILLAGVLVPLALVVGIARVMEPADDLGRSYATLQRLYDEARLDALLDPLTSLGNHRAFQEELERQISDARRGSAEVALMLLDLDSLKHVNDRFGHARGDDLLSGTGRLLTTSLRRGDRAFRIGGDEFAVIMPRTDLETAFMIGRRLLVAALETRIGSTTDVGISFSAGVSAYPSPSIDVTRLYHQADAALYWCKRHGRTAVQAFDPALHGSTGDDRPADELGEAVATVADQRLMRPAYQPIFDLRTGRPLGYEALVRPLEGSTFATAEALFTAAEATGRMVELDLACLDVIAADVDLPRNAYLAVNLSPRTLESREFGPGEISARFAAHGIAPAQIVVELTERQTIDDVDRLRANLESCRRAGMRIAADDVGAGNAGLRLLSQVEFDIVKIDLSLVQGGVLRESSLAVLRALRDLADRWHSTIVAEGVETGEQLETVRELGFSAVQGFLLSRPTATTKARRVDIDQLIAAEPSAMTEVRSAHRHQAAAVTAEA